jgi:hypothetical protein
VWTAEKADFEELTEKECHKSKRFMTVSALRFFWPRLTATSLAWVANDFAFYVSLARAGHQRHAE